MLLELFLKQLERGIAKLYKLEWLILKVLFLVIFKILNLILGEIIS